MRGKNPIIFSRLLVLLLSLLITYYKIPTAISVVFQSFVFSDFGGHQKL